MSIASVAVRIVELDNVTLKTSYGANVSRRRHIFVALTDSDGVTGYGEGSPLPHFSGERAEEMAPVIRDILGPAVIGIGAFDAQQVQAALEKALPHHSASKAAIVSALFDLQGRITGLPANAFMGGRLSDRVPVAGAVGIEDEATVIARVSDLWSRGIRTVKLKVGADPVRDLAILRRLRAEFPADLEIRADANTGFSFVAAQRFLHDVAPLRLQYLEQPLRPSDWGGLSRLRGSGTPIAVDESLFGFEDAMGIIAAGAADVFIIKLIKLGGLHQARKVVALAEAAGIACVAVSPYESPLGVAANLHLCAGSPAFSMATEVGVDLAAVRLPGAGDILSENGAALVPVGPGLGIDMPATLFASDDPA
jgi:o-succinylbenzoate synthase